MASPSNPGGTAAFWRAGVPLRAIAIASMGFAGYVAVGGLVSLLGWVLNVPRLTDWTNGGISIQPNAALAALCCGSAILLLIRGHRRPAAVFGAVLVAIGVATLFQYASGISLGIDTALMFGHTWGRGGVVFPGRMGLPASSSWTMLGAGILLAAGGTPTRRLAAGLAALPAGVSSLALIGYVYGASSLYTVPTVTIIALQTATFIMAAAIAMLLAIPEHGVVRFAFDGRPGGILARRAGVVAIAIPFCIGLVAVWVVRTRFVELVFSSALRSLIEMALLLALLAWAGRAVNAEARRREEAAAALLVAEQRFVDALENMSQGFVTVDSEWRYTYINAAAERLLGKTPEVLLGTPCWDCFLIARDGPARTELQRAASRRASVAFESEQPGTDRWFAYKTAPVQDGGLAIYFEDITARKQTDLELLASRAQLADDLRDTMLLQEIGAKWAAEPSSDEIHASIVEGARQLARSDFSSLELLDDDSDELRVIGSAASASGSAPDWDQLGAREATTSAAALRERGRVTVDDVDQCRFMAETAALAVYGAAGIRAAQSTPLVTVSGKLLGTLSTYWREPKLPSEQQLRLLDILAHQAARVIERRHLEERRTALLERERSARAEAERAARLMDEFLATVSHELRTPLNAVLGWADLLTSGALDTVQARRAAEVIQRNAQAQTQLISDLLDVSQILAGKMSLEVLPLDLATTIRGAMESIQPAAQAKEVVLDADLHALSRPMVGDAARLQQVVWNLLSNAVKFTPRGGRVHVELRQVGESAEVRVRDTGPGIASDFLPYVFDRFRQADGSSSRAHGGLGLGLAIVKQFVELHGGTVSAHSEGSGRGATFRVALPLVSGAIDATATVAPVKTRPLDGVRVLLVEDDPDARELAARILAESGAVVTPASSASEALRVLGDGSFDAITSDIGMPETDGYELIAAIRARGVDIPAVALTAFVRPEDQARALQAGFQEHLAKPLQPVKLIAALTRLVRASQSPAPQPTELAARD